MQVITITGYLSRDAEQRTTRDGTTITNLNVPVRQGFGEREQTNWFRVSVWGKRADFAAKFRKGEFIAVTGDLTIGEYDGKPQYEIRASDFQTVRPAGRDDALAQTQGSRQSIAGDLDDDIAF